MRVTADDAFGQHVVVAIDGIIRERCVMGDDVRNRVIFVGEQGVEIDIERENVEIILLKGAPGWARIKYEAIRRAEELGIERIQLKRTKVWRIPLNTVKVDRSTRWGNPYQVGGDDPMTTPGHKMTAADAVRMFEWYLESRPVLKEQVRESLRGKNLACWCGLGDPCHADVLLLVANA